MKVFVYCRDRAEVGMTAPVIRRLKARGWWHPSWKTADIVLIPGDRREAVRFALDVFEAGKRIWHLGAGDFSDGDACHYDGTYRFLISKIAMASSGHCLYLRSDKLRGINGADAFNCFGKWVVGPTMIDDLHKRLPRPTKKPYVLLCYNPNVWDVGEDFPQCGKGQVGYAMYPGNDGNRHEVKRLLTIAGWKVLPRMQRSKFLCWLANAENVIGNSSLLTYEAPMWHEDERIHFCGNRNAGRGIVRWDAKKHGSPSDNVIKLIEKEAKLCG